HRSIAIANGRVFFRQSEAAAARQVLTRVNTGSANPVAQSSAITPDGRFVVFATGGGFFAPQGGGGYVLDRDADGNGIFDEPGATTTLPISVNPDGTLCDGGVFNPTVSADGRFVAFSSSCSTLVPNDSNANFDIFVRDRIAGITTLVSVASD